MVNSDQGRQVTSQNSRLLLHDLSKPRTILRRRQCWNNVQSEGRFSTSRKQTWISKWTMDGYQAIRLVRGDWVRSWYNQARRQTDLSEGTVTQFEFIRAHHLVRSKVRVTGQFVTKKVRC